jgi:uncharacterized protein YcbK (DUF882 family)
VRFFTHGNGYLKIKSTKNRYRFAGRYRRQDGTYIKSALRRINRVFGASYTLPRARISLRLIELLAHLRKELKGGWIIISSGYRDPRYNRKLHDMGRTVAKSSLHQYGMAADLRIQGVKSKRIWSFMRERKLGGGGYYGSPWMHVDSGPPRWWTQGTANVRKGISEHNKRLILVPEHDRYAPGERLRLRFARMTAYPIGIQPAGFVLERRVGDGWEKVRAFSPRFPRKTSVKCPKFNSVDEMLGITWRLPARLQPGRYRIRASFCDVQWEAMPKQITSYELEVTR